jgi:hypothetical protein
MVRWLIPCLALLLQTAAVQAAPLDLKSVNEAKFTDKRGKGLSPIILKAQVLLDRARFSPGLIDGRTARTSRSTGRLRKGERSKSGGETHERAVRKACFHLKRSSASRARDC